MRKEDFLNAINSSVSLADTCTSKPVTAPSSIGLASKDTGKSNDEITNTEITTTPLKTLNPSTNTLETRVNGIENKLDNLEFSLSDDVTCPGCGITFDYTGSLKEKGFIGFLTSDSDNQYCFKCPCCQKELDQVTLKVNGNIITAKEYSGYLKEHGVNPDNQ